MSGAALQDGVARLQEEIDRLELLKETIDSVTAGDGAPVAEIGERLTCALEIASCALQRDTARLLHLARSPAGG